MLHKDRRSDYDVSNSIMVTSTNSVCNAVREIFISLYPEQLYSPVQQSFEDFERLFEGEFEGYQACDTFYHDKQHTLDMTLALARLIEGYQLSHNKNESLSAEYAVIALITALYHDSGYILSADDCSTNGSVYTKTHIARSADFLSSYLPRLGLDQYIEIARNIVHYTGYEIKPSDIKLPNQSFHIIGHMLGSADLIAQMSDRCYLEKCRDRLYPEFVLGDIAERIKEDGSTELLYRSGNHLLEQTPEFYNQEISCRLNNLFNGVYQCAEVHFGSSNLYIEALDSNINHLNNLLEEKRLDTLGRIPLKNNGTIIADSSNADSIRQLKIK